MGVLKGGRELPDDIRQKVQSDGSLVISPVQKQDDSGVYTCWARNKQGHSARRSGEVAVIGKWSTFHFAYTIDLLVLLFVLYVSAAFDMMTRIECVSVFICMFLCVIHSHTSTYTCIRTCLTEFIFHSSVQFFFAVYFSWKSFFLLSYSHTHTHAPFSVDVWCGFLCWFCFVLFHFISLTGWIECSRTNLKLNSFWIDLVLFSTFCFCLVWNFVDGFFSGLFCFTFPFRLFVNWTNNKYLPFSFFWWTRNFFGWKRKKKKLNATLRNNNVL